MTQEVMTNISPTVRDDAQGNLYDLLIARTAAQINRESQRLNNIDNLGPAPVINITRHYTNTLANQQPTDAPAASPPAGAVTPTDPGPVTPIPPDSPATPAAQTIAPAAATGLLQNPFVRGIATTLLTGGALGGAGWLGNWLKIQSATPANPPTVAQPSTGQPGTVTIPGTNYDSSVEMNIIPPADPTSTTP